MIFTTSQSQRGKLTDDQTKMASKTTTSQDTRAELGELVKRKAEIAVRYTINSSFNISKF